MTPVLGVEISIYNSRNFTGDLDLNTFNKREEIYNSRNFTGDLDRRIQRNPDLIYNSRNFTGDLDNEKPRYSPHLQQ